jgi:hypothetical protein
MASSDPSAAWDQAQITHLIRSFTAGRMAWSECDHAEHLTVALWFCRQYPASLALEKLRAGILDYYDRSHDEAAACGLSTYYHETATRFWITQVQQFLADQPPERTLAELRSELLQRYGDSRLIWRYYSRDRLKSRQAAQQWVEPDLQPLT